MSMCLGLRWCTPTCKQGVVTSNMVNSTNVDAMLGQLYRLWHNNGGALAEWLPILRPIDSDALAAQQTRCVHQCWLNIGLLSSTLNQHWHSIGCRCVDARELWHHANTRRSSNVGLMLGHRLRRWPNIDPPFGKRLVFAGHAPGPICQWVFIYGDGGRVADNTVTLISLPIQLHDLNTLTDVTPCN